MQPNLKHTAMSYEIIYDKQFIKAGENLYVPMILAGSNNCTEFNSSTGKERRARSWEAWGYLTPDNMKISTPEQMLKRIDEIRADKVERYDGKDGRDVYTDKQFGYFSSIAIKGHWAGTTFGAFKGIVVTGIAKALTVEQLKEEGVGISITMYDWQGESKAQAEKLGLPWLGTTYIKDSLHLVQAVKNYYETYKASGLSWHIGYDSHSLERNMKWIRKRHFPVGGKNKPEYEYVYVDNYFTLTFKWDGCTHYFVKKTRNGVRYTHYPYQRFATEREAKAVKNRLKGRLELTVVPVNERGQVKVVKKS